MNRKQYLDLFEAALGNLSPVIKEDILSDYREHFDVGLEQGQSEEEISAALGDPVQIAKQYRAEYLLRKADENHTASNILRAIFAALSLGFFNLLFMIPIFAVLVSVILSLYAAALGLIAGGIGGLAGTILSLFIPTFQIGGLNPAMLIFGSISVASFGLLFGLGTFLFTKLILRLTLHYIKANMRIISIKRSV